MSTFSLRLRSLCVPLSSSLLYSRCCGTRYLRTRYSYAYSCPALELIEYQGVHRRKNLTTFRNSSTGNLNVSASPTTSTCFAASKANTVKLILSREFCSNTEDDMPEGQFHEIADEFLEGLEPVLEVLEKYVQDGDFDVVYSQGVLTVELGEHGSWVLNKQTPNRQIWWSSPISGPKRFKYNIDTERWVNTRDGNDMLELLKEEIKTITGKELNI